MPRASEPDTVDPHDLVAAQDALVTSVAAAGTSSTSVRKASASKLEAICFIGITPIVGSSCFCLGMHGAPARGRAGSILDRNGFR
jgi:hypothetical protein